MKKNFTLFCITSLLCSNLYSQNKISSDSICNCIKTSNLEYPNKEYGITGTVIVEFNVDSTCHFSNPSIIQSLGKNFDTEAMRVIIEQIKFNNKCINTCKKKSNCITKKLRIPITFSAILEED